MKQKITLEIDNDTGVEFEEQAELKRVARGNYWISTFNDIIGPCEEDGYGIETRIILTPKVDTELELELAKKKFPVGSFFRSNRHGDTIFKVKEVMRFGGPGRIIVGADSDDSDIETFGFDVPDCQPFPLPTWRCCSSDKPKKTGEYPIRFKNNHKKYTKATFINNDWHDSWGAKIMIDVDIRGNREWLDEGEL